MSGWSPELEERSRKNLSAILKAFQRTTQARIAERFDLSEGTISKLKSDGELANAAKVLAAAGLKVVPHDFECHDPKYIASIEFLAHRQLTGKLQEQGDEGEAPQDGLQWT